MRKGIDNQATDSLGNDELKPAWAELAIPLAISIFLAVAVFLVIGVQETLLPN